jgi:hypothetical protein
VYVGVGIALRFDVREGACGCRLRCLEGQEIDNPQVPKSSVLLFGESGCSL